MPSAKEQIPIEQLHVQLRADAEIFDLPGGGIGLGLSGRFLRADERLAPLLPHLDGTKTLSDAVALAGGGGSPVAISLVLALVRGLSQNGFLANDVAELRAAGLGWDDRRVGIGRLLTALRPELSLRALARPATALLRPISRLALGPRTAAVAGAIAGALVLVFFALLARFPSDALELWQSHGYGLLALYLGASIALGARTLARGMVTVAEHQSLYGAGIRFHAIVLAPYFDCRNIFRAGRVGELRIAAAGAASTVIAAACLAAVCLILGGPGGGFLAHSAGLLTVGAVLVALVDLCPFYQSDLGLVFDLSLTSRQGRRKGLDYLRYRLIRNQGRKPPFDDELHHVIVASAAVAWVWAVFTVSARALTRQLLPALQAVIAGDDFLERLFLFAASVTLAVVIIGVFALLILGIGRFIVGHWPERKGRGRLVEGTVDAEAVLSGSPLFAHLASNAMTELARSAATSKYPKGSTVVRQGESGDVFFVIAHGDAAVTVNEPSGGENTVATLHKGDGFGEIALLESRPRTATVRALTPLTVVGVNREDFLAALASAGVANEDTTALLRGAHAIREADLFCHLAPSSVTRLIERCSREQFEPGTDVIREGEHGDRFYLIQTGGVVVTRSGDEVARFGPGDYFGELELLCPAPRVATVTTTAPTTLLSLNRDGFCDIVSHDFRAALRLEKVAEGRA